jgi:hypothetical protein
MTPAESFHRAALIAGAKSRAVPVASCVTAGLRPDHLLNERTWEELAALVIVLAAAADHQKLADIVAAPDDGKPLPGARERALRKAHAEVTRYRSRGMPVPQRLLVLEREYQRLHPRPGTAAAAVRAAVREAADAA